MSVITIQAPLTCPRDGCPGTVYAHMAKRPVTATTYYVHKVDDVCKDGDRQHILTECEWQRASEEAEEIARLWNEKQTAKVTA